MMMFIDNKEEVGAEGQRLNEPNIGVPIKKRPFQLPNPSSLESRVPALDKFSLMPTHFAPRSPLDFSPLGFDPGNSSSANLDKPAGVETNPLHELNAIDMERNYYPLKPSANPNLGMEMLQVGNAPKLQLSISGNMVKEKISQCSTDLSLTGLFTTSSKPCFKPSHNISKNMEKKSVFDLNLPTAETWDSAMDGFTSENNSIAHTEPVEVLAKQGNVSGMIPHEMGSGVFPNGVVAGLVPKEAVNNLKLPNIMMGKSPEKCNTSEVTLDLQLKLPPRPELRMKDLEPVCSSDLSLSLSGKDLNSSPEPVNVKPKIVEISQKSEDKDITNTNMKPAAQNQVIMKQESQEDTLPQKFMQASVSKNQSFASVSLVKKEPIDTVSHAQHTLGKLLDESPCSASESRLAKQTGISETNSLTKGIDLNTATPLPEVCTGSKTINLVLAERVVAGQIFQLATSQSDVCHKSENTDNRTLSLNMPCLTATIAPLVGTEDIKPVIVHSASPASVVDGKRMASMVSDGLSQGSADMDCSEEGQNLSKSGNVGKTTENTICEINASSSSSVAKIPKKEPSITGEFENVGSSETKENVRSLVPWSIPNSKENQIQTPMLVEASSVQNNESSIPSSFTKQIDLPDKNIQGDCLDMKAGGSKSRSPSISKSIRDKDVDLSSEKEDGTLNRQTKGNGILRSSFKRTDFGLDRPQFERKKSRWSSWDEGTNIHSNRGQRWEGHSFSQFGGDRFENEDNFSRRAGIDMANRKRQTNRFNNRFGHNKYNGFRFMRTNSNSDMNFDEGNDCRNNRPYPRFQNRRHITDVSPRGADELDAPVFERSNHYRRVDHTIRGESSSPGPRRGLHQWTPPGEMVGGHPDLLTRVDTRVRSPGRRPFFKKDNLNRRHVSPQYNRVHKPGRGMHWNNGRQRYDGVSPHGPVADAQDFEAYDELHRHGGEMVPFHGRYPDNDGAYSDGGGPHGRVRNYETAIPRSREVGDQDEYRYNNRVLHGRRDANPNNNGDESKRRRF